MSVFLHVTFRILLVVKYCDKMSIPPLRKPKSPVHINVQHIGKISIPPLRKPKSLININVEYDNMLIPPLRKPKSPVYNNGEDVIKLSTPLPLIKPNSPVYNHLDTLKYVILTIKDGAKLVVSSDAYHGIISAGNHYKCLLCNVSLKYDMEVHKISTSHKIMFRRYPFGAHLIRQLDKGSCFCTTCKSEIANHMLTIHLTSDHHVEKLRQALQKAENNSI